MTLTIAAAADLGHELRALLGDLRARGIRAEASTDAATHPEALEQLRRCQADCALLAGDRLAGAPESELTIAAVLERAEARDVLVPAADRSLTLDTISPGAPVGVPDLRTRGLLLAHRSDLEPVSPPDGGGLADSLRAGGLEAVVLGWAEARREGLSGRVSEVLDPQAWAPAAGRGALLLVCRPGEGPRRELEAVDHAVSRSAFLAESATARALGPAAAGSVGVHAIPHARWIRVWAMAASHDGGGLVRGDVTGLVQDPRAAGRALADLLLARGIDILFQEAET